MPPETSTAPVNPQKARKGLSRVWHAGLYSLAGLRAIADGSIDIAPWLGGRIGLSGVAQAITELSGPLAPVRTVVDPRQL